jgi:hypothetical protein
MSKDEIQKLIGGYATGSLTDDERRQLFEAALDDQELFDALQDEQALKELLDDPVSREQIRRAAAESLPRAMEQAKPSWFRKPWIWAAGTGLAAAAVLLAVLVPWNHKRAEIKQVAMVRQEAPTPPPQLPTHEPPVKPAPPTTRRMAAKKEERRAAPAAAPAPAPAASPAQVPAAAPAAAPQTPQPAAPPPPEQAESAKTKSADKDLAPAPRPPELSATNGQIARVQRPAAAFRSKAIAGTVGSIAPQLAFHDTGGLSFARRLEDGSYVNVPTGAVFHPAETLRLTIVPGLSGPIAVLEWDSTTSSWMRLFPPEGETVQVRGLERYTVPIDIVVKPGERLRVTVASGASEIPLEVR